MGTHCGSGSSAQWAVGAEWTASPGNKRPCSGEEFQEESAPQKRSRSCGSAGELALVSAEGEVVHAPASLREFFLDGAGAKLATVRGEVLRHLVWCLQALPPAITARESVADNVELLAAAEVITASNRKIIAAFSPCRLPHRFSPFLLLFSSSRAHNSSDPRRCSTFPLLLADLSGGG
jgi:hypothetical protein